MISTNLQELERNGYYYSSPSGNSMEPLFFHKQNVVRIEKAVHPLHKYDLTLHVKSDGTSVLHRVVKVDNSNVYTIRGDNCIKSEYVYSDQIIGIVTQFYRNGRWVSVRNWKYLLYVHIWCGLFPLRRILKVLRGRISKSI